MPIPQGYTLKVGNYKDDKTGVVFYACNCPSQPQNRTLRHIAANPSSYTPWPAPAK